MKKTRIAIVGLGMAVTPHARSALDLADRVEVAYAYSPSAERRAQFAGKFSFPQCDELEAILDAIERGGEPRVNGEEALRVHRLIDALLEAAAKGAAFHFSPAGMGTR